MHDRKHQTRGQNLHGYNYRLHWFRSRGTFFPLDEFNVSDYFKIVKDPINKEAAIACLAIDTGDVEHGFLECIPIANKEILTFAALYSFFSPLALQIEEGNVSYSIKDNSELGKNLSIADWKLKISLSEESQKRR